ncbi:MAG: hypothetical protein ACE368_00030 [Paracoccaceae bacterium]
MLEKNPELAAIRYGHREPGAHGVAHGGQDTAQKAGPVRKGIQQLRRLVIGDRNWLTR